MTTKLTNPLLALSALFVLAGGYIHLTEYLDVYRDLPAEVPGAWVVQIGFPVNVAVSVLAAIALVAVATKTPRFRRVVVAAVIGFQLSSLAVLILSRTGSVFEWTEPVWNDAANQTRAVEIGALVCLMAALVLDVAVGRRAGAADEA